MPYSDDDAVAVATRSGAAEPPGTLSEDGAERLLGDGERSAHLLQIMEAVLEHEAMTITELKANPGKVVKALADGPQWVMNGKSADEAWALMISKPDVMLLYEALVSAAQPRYLSASAFAARLRHDGLPSAVALNPPAETPYERPANYLDALMGQASG